MVRQALAIKISQKNLASDDRIQKYNVKISYFIDKLNEKFKFLHIILSLDINIIHFWNL